MISKDLSIIKKMQPSSAMNKEFYISLVNKQLSGQISDVEQIQLQRWLNEDTSRLEMVNEIKKTFEKTPEEVVQKKPISLGKIIGISAAAVILILVVAGLWWKNASQPAMEIVAARDGKIVELKDGSVVTLAKGSSLEYTESFNISDRNISFLGQAVFDVAKGEVPFIITTYQATIKVLGTKFELNDDAQNQMIYIKVMEGEVSIELNNGEDRTIKTGEQMSIDALAGTFTLPRPVPRLAVRNFEFKETPIQTVVEELQKNYNVEIGIDDRMINCVFTGTFNNKSLENIFKIMDRKLNSNTFLQTDGAYLIEGEGCSE